MTEAAWRVEITKRAQRDLVALPVLVRQRVLAALEGLKSVPRTGDIKKLSGGDSGYRLRVGNYRVFYTLSKDERTIYVEGVRHRSSAYER